MIDPTTPRRQPKLTWRGEPIADPEAWAAARGEQMVELIARHEGVDFTTVPPSIQRDEYLMALPESFAESLTMHSWASGSHAYIEINRRAPRVTSPSDNATPGSMPVRGKDKEGTYYFEVPDTPEVRAWLAGVEECSWEDWPDYVARRPWDVVDRKAVMKPVSPAGGESRLLPVNPSISEDRDGE